MTGNGNTTGKVRKITVYFTNGRKAPFLLNRTCFRTIDGDHFSFGEQIREGTTYQELIRHGWVFVNWENVSFLQLMEDEDETD